MQEYKQEYKQALTKEYINLLSISEYTDSDIYKYIDEYIKSKYESSLLNRIFSDLTYLKYSFFRTKSNIICTVFKAKRHNTTANYGYLYSVTDQSAKNILYICLGGTFDSKDGEFRYTLQTVDKVKYIELKYKEQFELIEQFVSSEVSEGNLELYSDIFYPIDFFDKKNYEDFINNSRYAIKFFVLCWLQDFYRIHNDTIENHINPAYINIIYNSDDLVIFEEVKKLFENEQKTQDETKTYSLMIEDILCSPFRKVKKNFRCVMAGQKIFPATVNEIINLNDIQYPIWREYYINLQCSNLVVNFICPSFALVNTWFFIQNMNPGLFDNASQFVKFEQSEIAKSISEVLHKEDKHNYIKTGDISVPRNAKFERFSSKINKSINYAESNIILSDFAICVHSEYVGRTFADLPMVEEKYAKWIFQHESLFQKHIFEYIYAFYCMNTKNSMIHGDPHANNITVYSFRQDYNYSRFPKTKILYILCDEKTREPEFYVFPHITTFSMLIDFSRGIIADKEALERKFGSRYAELYFRNQRDRIIRILSHYFPLFTDKNKDKLYGLMLDNFYLFFKVFSAIDIYGLCSGISMTLRKNKCSEKYILFVNGVKKQAEELLIGGLRQLINKKITSPSQIGWPAKQIITDNFQKYINNLSEGDQIIDIFNYNAYIKYDMSIPEKEPKFITELYINLRKKYNIPVEEQIAEWESPKEELSDIDNIIETQKMKIQSEDISAFKSSWAY